MQREINTRIDIDATPETVWRTLIDLPSFGEWNDLLPRAAGRLEVGEKVRFRFRVRPLPTLRFAARVLEVEPSRALRWAGTFGLAAIFRAEHYFLLERIDTDRTRFRHGEIFSGALTLPVWALLRRGGPRAYARMNDALKRRAELP